MKTLPIIEQHFHGAYGVDFNTAGVNEIVDLAQKLYAQGIDYFFPTLVTDSVENIKRQNSLLGLKNLQILEIVFFMGHILTKG